MMPGPGVAKQDAMTTMTASSVWQLPHNDADDDGRSATVMWIELPFLIMHTPFTFSETVMPASDVMS
jgi:hypothetical protein